MNNKINSITSSFGFFSFDNEGVFSCSSECIENIDITEEHKFDINSKELKYCKSDDLLNNYEMKSFEKNNLNHNFLRDYLENKKFIHLHTHTENSLLDGLSNIKDLVLKCKELGMDSVAITDHGNMLGVIDFYKECKAQGIKPIIGCEVYVSEYGRMNKTKRSDSHLVLLCKNEVGYNNLCKIVSDACVNGFYYKPRTDLEFLKEHSEGLICLSACVGGIIPQMLLVNDYEGAKKVAIDYYNAFNGEYYIEIQNHYIEDEIKVLPQLIRLAQELNIPIVATNDSHYINKKDSFAHQVLLCMQTKSTLDNPKMSFGTKEFYFKSQEEMYSLFANFPESCAMTQVIADKCNLEFEFHEVKMPIFEIPDGYTAQTYLKKLTYEGFAEFYPNEQNNQQLIDRIEYELRIIHQMGFDTYFLIVADYIVWAKNNGIAVGTGRGSAVGSLVSRCMKITSVCPIKYNLLFERFLNPERVSMPDIDTDFDYYNRYKVIEYVTEKYGSDKVAQIVTKGTMASRSAIRDVARVLSIPLYRSDEVAKMIPETVGITIKKAMEENPKLKDLYNNDEEVKKWIDIAMLLEGLPKQLATHASGVLICDKPVTDYVPLINTKTAIDTQYDMTTLEELGLLKMDFLGLKTLSVIQGCIEEVKKNYGIDIDIDNIDVNDKNVFDFIATGNTVGCFQLEEAGMQGLMRSLKPTSIEDLTAGIALYRPGPMDFIPKYLEGKNNPNNIRYLHDKLEPILNTTYGCIVYQEQIMQIVRDLGGYSLGRSDLVRRAMAKKKPEVMAKERAIFINGEENALEPSKSVDGCVKRGISQEIAEEIFEEMTDFAKYAFNKSHACAYAVIAYQTCWLKYYYPKEYMASLLTSVYDKNDKLIDYLDECRRLGINIIAPNINRSLTKFTIDNGDLIFALCGVKGCGFDITESIVQERNKNGIFKSLTDFCKRVSKMKVNKTLLERLIQVGAFDCLSGTRKQYCMSYERLLNSSKKEVKKNVEGQISLFEICDKKDSDINEDVLPNVGEYSKRQILEFEKELLNVYLSGYPLDEYKEYIDNFSNCNTSRYIIDENEEKSFLSKPILSEIRIAGVIISVKTLYTKKKEEMAFLKIQDQYGEVDVVVFPKLYEQVFSNLKTDNVIFVVGSESENKDGKISIIANSILCSVSDLQKKQDNKDIFIRLEYENVNDFYKKIQNKLIDFQGSSNIYIYEQHSNKTFKLNETINSNNTELIVYFQLLVGNQNVVLYKD